MEFIYFEDSWNEKAEEKIRKGRTNLTGVAGSIEDADTDKE